MKKKCAILSAGLLGAFSFASAQSAFQPYSAQGDNLIHVTTADFDAIGAKDYVVGMSVDNKLMAFNRPALIVDPSSSTNRLWEFDLPTFAVMIAAADTEGSNADEILVPGLDGRLRILSASGALLHDKSVGSGAMYCVDIGRTTGGAVRIITGGVDGNIYFLNASGAQIGSKRPQETGIIRRVVAGNFDGIGGDEVMVFYSKKGFAGARYIEVYDLDTLSRPTYWGLTEPLIDDVGPTKSWVGTNGPSASTRFSRLWILRRPGASWKVTRFHRSASMLREPKASTRWKWNTRFPDYLRT